jgi:hypothetical protein
VNHEESAAKWNRLKVMVSTGRFGTSFFGISTEFCQNLCFPMLECQAGSVNFRIPPSLKGSSAIRDLSCDGAQPALFDKNTATRRHRSCIGGTGDWQLLRPTLVDPLPTGLVPVEAVIES